jgi:hypothetical protein
MKTKTFIMTALAARRQRDQSFPKLLGSNTGNATRLPGSNTSNARMAFLTAREGLERNVPESVAQVTGGECFTFTNTATLSRHLIDVSNDVPNYYILSFRPQSPQPGFHALKLRDRPGLRLSSREAYWVDGGTTANNK